MSASTRPLSHGPEPADAPTEGLPVAGWAARPHPGLYAALLLTSTALLTLELSLTRLFSYTVWYHFAYLTISVALLGFGSSGAIVAAFPHVFRTGGQRLLVRLLCAAALLVAVALVVLSRVPLEINAVVDTPIRFSAMLLGYYLIVGAPFLLGGFAVALPFAAYPRLMGRLYFWDLLGAALGCIVVVALIETLTVPGLILAAAGLLLAAAAALAIPGPDRRSGLALALAAVVVVAGAEAAGSRLPVRVTSSKSVARRNAADHYVKWTALSRVDAYDWEHPRIAQFWGWIGIRPNYKAKRPPVATLTYDGSNGSNIYPYAGNFDHLRILDGHLLRLPYLLRAEPRVLVIGVGGGIDMMNAVKRGARHVTGIELQPETVYLLKDRLRAFTGGFYDRPDVTLVAGEGRHFVRKSRETFDVIQITAVDTFAAQATGAYVLAESYLYTVEAVRDFLARLADDGVLTLVMGDFVTKDPPPLGSRLALLGHRALEEMGARRPQDHLLVVAAPHRDAGAQAESVLVKKTPFTADEIRTVQDYARANGFTLLWAPSPDDTAEYPFSPLLGRGEAARRAHLDAAAFRMDAIHDRSPFFYNVAKWQNFSPWKSIAATFPGSFIGQLVLVLMLGQSLLLGGALILFPLARGAREGLHTRGVLAYLAYFLALGVGFMFVEISFVQYFVLFLGSPTHALSVTIFSLLLFSSLGSLLSTRFVERPEAALRRLAPAAALLVLLYALGLGRLFDVCLHLEFPARVAIASAAQLPLGLLLGMFMPLGIACVSREHPRLVPWAWGINGIGSVVGTTLAVVLAMTWSFTLVALLAAALYLVGTALMVTTARATRPEHGRHSGTRQSSADDFLENPIAPRPPSGVCHVLPTCFRPGVTASSWSSACSRSWRSWLASACARPCS